MPSWDVVNGAPLQWRLAEGGLSLLVYIMYVARVGGHKAVRVHGV